MDKTVGSANLVLSLSASRQQQIIQEKMKKPDCRKISPSPPLADILISNGCKQDESLKAYLINFNKSIYFQLS